MSVNTSDPTIGRLIDGRYQVRSRIARGGMATVYLATDLRLERRVAIKIMHGHLADDSQFKQRFIQEARSAARLAHPNVVNVFDQGQDSESAYLVMEYLPGITLRELLHDYGALTSEQTIDISEAVLAGLAAAHKAGIVHRDLKPENVLLADDGRIKIGDFGLARAASNNTATGAALLGTIAYLSPELVTRGVADTRSDIYAVGIMMYEMLTGEQPFKGEQPMQIAYQHANDSVPTPSTKNPKVPAELDELVLWATARNPEERPADARALLDQLHDTESLLQTALPATPTSAQRTMVLPSAPAMPPPSNAETMVLGGRGPAPVSHTDEVSDTTSALNIASQKRRKRLPLIILLVLLLAAGAGTAGWWFGIGPGAQVAIPSNLESLSIEDATLALEELDLTVSETAPGGFSLDVPEGAVIQTDPAFGTSVQRGSAVTLLLSQGAEPVVVAPMAGVALTDVQAALAEQDIRIADGIDFRFDAEIERDVVIAATKDGDNFSDGGDAFRGDEVALVVSSGPLPDVANATPEVATSALEDAGLQVDADPRLEYSSGVAEGRVIGLVQNYDTPLRPDASVTLVVSRGPELFPIPDVSGQTFNQARETLQGAGFEVTIDTNAPQFFWDTAVVQTMEPEAGTPVEAGTNVSVRGFFD